MRARRNFSSFGEPSPNPGHQLEPQSPKPLGHLDHSDLGWEAIIASNSMHRKTTSSKPPRGVLAAQAAADAAVAQQQQPPQQQQQRCCGSVNSKQRQYEQTPLLPSPPPPLSPACPLQRALSQLVHQWSRPKQTNETKQTTRARAACTVDTGTAMTDARSKRPRSPPLRVVTKFQKN